MLMNTEKQDIIVNRVTNSGLLSLDLEDFYHHGKRVIYDLRDNLFMGMILKEKEFRDFLKTHDWSQYAQQNVAIVCSEDAIVPTWAYMLLSIKLQPYANCIVFGDLNDLESKLFYNALSCINPSDYTNKKVVIKGCSKYPVPTSAYIEITQLLQPYVQSLMFGEPCSTVPLYKAVKKISSKED
jgi:Protein of unknown function (DUF2480)